MKSFVAALGVVLLTGSTASAHPGYVPFIPVVAPPPVTYYQPAPVVAAYPPAPAVAAYPVAPPTYYYAPAPVAIQPVVPTGYTVASPVLAPPMLPAPVVAPLPAPFYATSINGRPVIVHPKVYVPGEPIRNVLRAITP